MVAKIDQEHQNDISIGEDHWIAYVDLDGRYDSAVNIDSEIRELEPMWSALEVHCVAACCGIEAFDFWLDSVDRAKQTLDGKDISAKLVALRAKLESVSGEVFLSQRLNNYCDKKVFIALLNHLYKCFSDTSVCPIKTEFS